MLSRMIFQIRTSKNRRMKLWSQVTQNSKTVLWREKLKSWKCKAYGVQGNRLQTLHHSYQMPSILMNQVDRRVVILMIQWMTLTFIKCWRVMNGRINHKLIKIQINIQLIKSKITTLLTKTWIPNWTRSQLMIFYPDLNFRILLQI